MNTVEYIEIRVKYPGNPHVALIDGLNKSYNLNRSRVVGEYLYHRREYLDDGTQEQVYRLPLFRDAIYEIKETINGNRAYRYVAVYQGVLHRITRDAVERIAEGSLTLRQWSKTDDDEYGDVL